MPPTLDGNWAAARAINDRGQIVGEAKDLGNNSRAFIWIPYLQNITDLNSYLSPSQQLSWTLLAAWGINDQGRIVGWAAKKNNNVFQYYIPFLLYPN